MFKFIVIFIIAAFSTTVFSHQNSHSQMDVYVSSESITGEWDVDLIDLSKVLHLDVDLNGKLTWREALTKQIEIQRHLSKSLIFHTDGTLCEIDFGAMRINKLSTGMYANFVYDINCYSEVNNVEIAYNFMFDVDASHKVIVKVHSNDNISTYVLDANKRHIVIEDNYEVFTLFKSFVEEGLWHIWVGIDHILFIILLLLPSVFYTRDGKRDSHKSFLPVFKNVVKVVTAFTIAHSFTLCLTVLGFISMPSYLVESAIAVSIVITAIINMQYKYTIKLWALVFVFGLIHGMGFASVLMDLELPAKSEIVALLAFNVGVEIGQVVIVFTILPLVYYFRNNTIYKRIIYRLASISIATVGVVWFVERIANVELLNWA